MSSRSLHSCLRFHITTNDVLFLPQKLSRHLSTKTDIPDFSAKTLFSPERKAACIKKLGQTQSIRKTKLTKETKKSAVLIPLVDLPDGSAAIMFTKRSAGLRSHRGEVSFPGGKADLEDGSLVETACRETWEELGIPQDQIQIWAEMPPLASKDRGDYTATPIVGHIQNFNQSNLKINPSEVGEAFCVPISQLCDSQYHGYTQFRTKKMGYSLPVYFGPPHVIWGLTGIMTFQLLKALVGTKFYKHKLRFQSPLTPDS